MRHGRGPSQSVTRGLRPLRRLARATDGQATVELAIVLLVLTTMVFGYGVEANFSLTDKAAAIAVPPKVDLGGIGTSGVKK